MPKALLFFLSIILLPIICLAIFTTAGEQPKPPRAWIDGTGPQWRSLTGDDFVNVNCKPDTWTWEGGHARCTGTPVGVIRSIKPYKNFELVAEWKHLTPGGNSGIFIWAGKEYLESINPGQLPKQGIEIQVLDTEAVRLFEEKTGRKSDGLFTSHGDVFPVRDSKMNPFPPAAANGERSFPTKYLTRKTGEWNHYYVRCINGEVRLWVNGEEVSGGTGCTPSEGYLCLESEGAAVEFKGIRIRELP